MATVNFEHQDREVIIKTFLAVSDYLKENPNPGACHLISGILYVLLSEQNIESVLKIGEVKQQDGKYFDHSWIEINNKIFDVAIQLTYDEQENPPVFAGIDLGDGRQTALMYGEVSPYGLGADAEMVLSQPFGIYMDCFPLYKNGAWQIIRQIARKRLGFDVNIPSLRDKYAEVKRVL